jgi:hypothetical protein
MRPTSLCLLWGMAVLLAVALHISISYTHMPNSNPQDGEALLIKSYFLAQYVLHAQYVQPWACFRYQACRATIAIRVQHGILVFASDI